jgi:hypothetical protein
MAEARMLKLLKALKGSSIVRRHHPKVSHTALRALPARQASLLCHRSVLLLEPIAQSLRSLHVLVYASHDAALFARGEGLAFEAVDAVVEALLDEVGVHLAWSASTVICMLACSAGLRS